MWSAPRVRLFQVFLPQTSQGFSTRVAPLIASPGSGGCGPGHVHYHPLGRDGLALCTDHPLLALCFVLPDTIRFSPCKPSGFSPQWNVTTLRGRFEENSTLV